MPPRHATPFVCLCFGFIVTFALMPARAIDAPAPNIPPVDALRTWLEQPAAIRPTLDEQLFSRVGLNKTQALEARKMLLRDHTAQIHATREAEWKAETITLAGQALKWKHRQFGTKPKDGWNLYISLHGGGGAPTAVNDQQWENQIKLYQPKDSLYIAPRAPTDHWNLWHEPPVDVLFNRLIEDAIVLGGVNPNRVYIMGYSAGGDGVYQLAPRMADRWAAAAMMAGHPNDASPLGLRNIGFTIHVGALDDAYDRNKVAAEWGLKLDALLQSDPTGYPHLVQLHAGRSHWMNLEDKVAVDWMAGFTRNPLPEKVVWKQSSTTHDHFYWLAMPPGEAKAGQLVVAKRKNQEIIIESAEAVKSVILRLNDAMLDLDQPVTVSQNGAILFKGIVPRTVQQIQSSLAEHGDPFLIFDACITVPIAN